MMLFNHIKSASTHIIINKLFTAINLLGLSVGLVCCLLVFQYVMHESGYDRFHPDAERTYRVSWNFSAADGARLASNKAFVGPALAEELAAVEQFARISHPEALLIRREETAFYEDGLYLADNSLFDLFSFEWLRGDPAQALSAPFTVVLTESFARRYFGEDDPMGQTLQVENALPIMVTGVVRDLPGNTHLEGEAFVSIVSGTAFDPEYLTGGGRFVFHTYIRLASGAAVADIEAQLPDFLQRQGPEYASRGSLEITPLVDIHLSSPRDSQLKESGSVEQLYAFVLVALGILTISVINFMNLSTSRAMQRAKEVGMRKSIGATRSQLIQQFLVESVLLAGLAMLLALMLLELSLPVFNTFTGVELSFDVLGNPATLLLLIFLSLLVGVAAGSYPAFYLSAFHPGKVLKGELSQGSAGQAFRNLLVVGQFAMAIILIVATAVIYLQTTFARNLDTGLSRERIVILEGTPLAALGPQWEVMRQQLLSHQNISTVTASRDIPGSQADYSYDFWFEGRGENGLSILVKIVDYDFFETYDIDLQAGRSFQRDFPADRMQLPETDGPDGAASYILNVAAARLIGWSPEQAVDNWLLLGFGAIRGDVIGVVEDVHYESVRSPIKPIVYILGHTQTDASPFSDDFIFRNASIRVTGDEFQETLDFIDSTWESFMPNQPVTHYFLNQRFDALYQSEMNLGRLLGYFSVLAVLIASMGLFGLATFNAQRRTKEIGVRKVMGGSVWSIVLLLTNDFSKLVLISNLIAWPVAYIAMNRWLENFAYRIDLTPLIFIGSGLIALCIAWVTVGGTAARAASQKPVLALRYE